MRRVSGKPPSPPSQPLPLSARRRRRQARRRPRRRTHATVAPREERLGASLQQSVEHGTEDRPIDARIDLCVLPPSRSATTETTTDIAQDDQSDVAWRGCAAGGRLGTTSEKVDEDDGTNLWEMCSTLFDRPLYCRILRRVVINDIGFSSENHNRSDLFYYLKD